VNALQNLSESLIKLSHNSSVNQKISAEIISLKDESKQAVRKMQGLAKLKKIQIDNKIGPHYIQAVKGTFSDLLTIFIDNAIKYSPEKTTVSLFSTTTDGIVLISIKDQGIGIKKSEQSKIFNRFYRTDESRSKSPANGYGLGLSIALKIINSLQGKVEIESEDKQGTTFTITLPRAKKT
jgi:signal transduction histidine kinase